VREIVSHGCCGVSRFYLRFKHHTVDSVAGVAVVSRLIDGETQENRTVNGRQVSPPLFSLEPAATPKPIFKKGMIRQLVLFL
jgi:hypothetical protein